MIKLLNTIIYFSIRLYFGSKNRIGHIALVLYLKKALHYNYLKYFGVETRFGYVHLVGFPLIKKCPNSRIIIEKGVTLISNSKENVAGINHPVILATLAEGASITIEQGSGLSGTAVCAANSIVVGKNSGLGVNTCLYDTDFHSIRRTLDKPASIKEARAEPVVIGKSAWVGANSMILKGVHIGEGAVIGAGSVVRSDIDDHVIAIGNPAKVTRKIVN